MKEKQLWVTKKWIIIRLSPWIVEFISRNILHVVNQSIVGAGIAQWYSAGLRVGWSGVRVLAGAGNFYHRVQTGPGSHPASHPVDIRVSFRGGKAAEARSWPFTST
jgi:hypothetical protein